jgi:hypothetical protein
MLCISTIFIEVVPVVSWLGLVITIVFSTLAFLLRDAYLSIKKKGDHLELRISKMEDDVEKERNRSDEELRKIDMRINDFHVNILTRLDEIKDKFNEFRK